MMRWLVLILAMAATSAAGDEITKIEQNLALEAARLKLLAEQKKVSALRLEIAEEEKKISAALLKAAQDDAAAETAKRGLGVANISINSGVITVVNDATRFCLATDYLIYHCHGNHSCPEFTVNADVCKLPGGEDEAMLLKVNYSCDKQVRDKNIKVGDTARITCK